MGRFRVLECGGWQVCLGAGGKVKSSAGLQANDDPCGSGLARDDGGRSGIDVTDVPLSRASPLTQGFVADHRNVYRSLKVFRVYRIAGFHIQLLPDVLEHQIVMLVDRANLAV
jgi:hypothetical protein